MSKTFVLDANVLLHDPESIYSFEDNDIVILLSILTEVDSFKKSLGELGANAREVARELDKLSKEGNLSLGVKLPGGGNLKINNYHKMNLELDFEKVDNCVISEVAYLRSIGKDAIIVSKDTMLRVVAHSLNLPAEDYETDAKNTQTYSGTTELSVSKEMMTQFAKDKKLIIPDYKGDPNQYVSIFNNSGKKSPLLGKTKPDNSIELVRNDRQILNIKPKNLEQHFAFDALLDDSIRLVTLQGRAGTGKTLIAVVAGLSKILDGDCARLVITRPTIPVGRDMGFLPGGVEEKMDPWMQPIHDALDMIKELDRKSGKSSLSSKFEEKDLIHIAPLAYLRGRSIPHSFLILDEAQNLTPKEIKTFITRCGEDTKIVVTGDIDQIDNPFLDKRSNGFAYLISKFKPYSIHAHVQLNKGERSKLAEIAAEIL